MIIGTGGLAGLIGCMLGGIFTQNGYGKEAFLIVGAIAILINISACFLDKNIEVA